MLDLSSMANSPFKPGQLVEERTFLKGYRGAWFRCKIKEITKKKGMLGHIPEYYDFPDHKSQWTKLYKVNTKGKRALMLRPKYPPIYNEKQMLHVNEVSEVKVIVCDSWKVGDLVDWWNSHCFWSGRITELFDDQEAQIELNPPPLGEGESYKVEFKDLRPSLDWTPEHGWTLLTQEDGTLPSCARLIKPINQVTDRLIPIDDTNNVSLGTEDVQRSLGVIASSLLSSPVSSNSAVSREGKSKLTTEMNRCFRGTTLSKEPENDIEKSSSQGCGDSNIRKRSRADADSRQSNGEEEVEVVKDDLNCTDSRQSTAKQEVKVVQDDLNGADSRPSTVEQEVKIVEDYLNCRNYWVNGRGALNSKYSDKLEATILDLEEYINKVKGLKKLLLFGISPSENQRPQWNFEDPNDVSEIPK